MKTSFAVSVFSALAAVTGVTATPLRPLKDVVKRSPDGNFTLYDYGVTASPIKLFYADGMLSMPLAVRIP